MLYTSREISQSYIAQTNKCGVDQTWYRTILCCTQCFSFSFRIKFVAYLNRWTEWFDSKCPGQKKSPLPQSYTWLFVVHTLRVLARSHHTLHLRLYTFTLCCKGSKSWIRQWLYCWNSLSVVSDCTSYTRLLQATIMTLSFTFLSVCTQMEARRKSHILPRQAHSPCCGSPLCDTLPPSPICLPHVLPPGVLQLESTIMA